MENSEATPLLRSRFFDCSLPLRIRWRICSAWRLAFDLYLVARALWLLLLEGDLVSSSLFPSLSCPRCCFCLVVFVCASLRALVSCSLPSSDRRTQSAPLLSNSSALLLLQSTHSWCVSVTNSAVRTLASSGECNVGSASFITMFGLNALITCEADVQK